MLIVDTREQIPLDFRCMGWSADSIQKPNAHIAVIPIIKGKVKQVAESFAYEIAANQPWAWPDLSKTTAALVADLSSYSFARFSLMVGTKPNEEPSTEAFNEILSICSSKEAEGAWAEFEKERQKAIIENDGATTYDSFPVMLTVSEENAVRSRLYSVLGMF